MFIVDLQQRLLFQLRMGEWAYRRRHKASFDRREFEVIVDDILHRFTELAIGLERVYLIDHDMPVHMRLA